jgi:hypothetical protein
MLFKMRPDLAQHTAHEIGRAPAVHALDGAEKAGRTGAKACIEQEFCPPSDHQNVTTIFPKT